jgi:hypothetical protein
MSGAVVAAAAMLERRMNWRRLKSENGDMAFQAWPVAR